ncbi:MAG: chemotaxis protein CheX [Lachnospiraceae bacterium]|nr:chemotaxis protein CheX [Lachnospiraceae bacterium]
MIAEINVEEILDSSVRDISRRVGKLEVIDSQKGSVGELESPLTVCVETTGERQEVLSFCVDGQVMETMARNMMHGAEVNEKDIEYCAMEFFNILCGRVISTINRTYNTRMRFSVPSIRKGNCSNDEGEKIWSQWSYNYSCGAAKFIVMTKI